MKYTFVNEIVYETVAFDLPKGILVGPRKTEQDSGNTAGEGPPEPAGQGVSRPITLLLAPC